MTLRPLLASIWDTVRQFLCCTDNKDKLTDNNGNRDGAVVFKNPTTVTTEAPTVPTSTVPQSNGLIPHCENTPSDKPSNTPSNTQLVVVDNTLSDTTEDPDLISPVDTTQIEFVEEVKDTPHDTPRDTPRDTDQIELIEEDTEDMVSKVAMRIVEDAIHQAVASEIVSLVICRAIGFLLAERATSTAQSLLSSGE